MTLGYQDIGKGVVVGVRMLRRRKGSSEGNPKVLSYELTQSYVTLAA